MFLDASRFESYLDWHSGYQSDAYNKIDYALDGNAILLRLVEARTYGGQIRMYLNAEGKAVDTGSTSNPMRVRRPFRLGPMSAYILHFHLSVNDLPEEAVAHIVPTEQMAKIGVLFTDVHTSEGDLVATIVPLRMIEICEGYPVALLTFIPKEACTMNKDDEKEEKTEEKKESAPKTKAKTSSTKKAGNNAKSTRTRA